MTLPSGVGFYGKLPSHGDFLRRRLSNSFVRAWDAWLQSALRASRETLGDGWLEVYLTSPAWRFVAAPGACGAALVAGVMAPSVDRAGRYFPLTIAAELPVASSLVGLATRATRFFDVAERLLIETLAAEESEFDRFDDAVTALERELEPAARGPRVVLGDAAALDVDASGWHLPIAGTHALVEILEQLLSQRLMAAKAPPTLWWSDGSSRLDPSLLVHPGLPQPRRFAAMLAGDWTERDWRSVDAHEPAPAAYEPLAAGGVVSVQSMAATHVGLVRASNEDAFVDRPDVGVWAVADGLGGHRNGDVASRLVCDALADFVPTASFDEAIDAARCRLSHVNDYLLRHAEGGIDGSSTVAALLVRGHRSAVIWAGDSRVYRLRDGHLEQLTIDHDSGPGTGDADEYCVTRAVGADADLVLDLHVDEVSPGDRFLLCSDGLTRVVGEGVIATSLGAPDIRAGVADLIAATLDAGAPDNVTVVIVDAKR